jgi:hypothetical protein
MRQLLRILSGGIAVALLGVGLSACDPTEADPRLEPPVVRIATVEPAARVSGPSRASSPHAFRAISAFASEVRSSSASSTPDSRWWHESGKPRP